MNKRDRVIGIVKYFLGLLGFIGIILAVLTATNLLDDVLVNLDKPRLSGNEKLTISLISSIVGIFLLFIAFTRQIDKFFQVLENTELKKKSNRKGLTAETLFFSVVAVILVVLALMLATNFLELKANLPLIGGATRIFLIAALVVLALLAIFTAFNETIIQSVKEMKKVTWPTGKQMLDYSIKVFSFIVFFSVLFLLLDIPISYLIGLII
jgi:preprotein translocase subunit SecE